MKQALQAIVALIDGELDNPALHGYLLSESTTDDIYGIAQDGLQGTDEIKEEMHDALIAVNKYFVDLQNKVALTSHDESAWKKVAAVLLKADNEKAESV